ncbi:hypothetical protein SAMN04487860_10351 [Ruminococcus flavefaciens]|uniref:Uncharacterized protein n=2 Tax=Ruminococcus flavefaciens TaxID=1265 RepID=A0A1M7HSE5_RUMFL|nr:hypothetical protein SAMN04487860_10351 [Ruminococcus flavefaciens]
MMTSEEFVEDLRKSGVMLLKNNGSLTDIPSDFLSKATEFCKSMGCSSVIYDIYDPQDSEHTELTVSDCGYAE